MKKKPPPITRGEMGADGFSDQFRRDGIGGKGLRAVQHGLIPATWGNVKLHGKIRNALEEWGLAEFKVLDRDPSGNPNGGAALLVIGRLTERGRKVRDDYDRRQAEAADRAIQRERREKRKARK